ncbi:RnfH family protein [Marinospirillum perlucidum]|uniref:RnfH family protein n=1 Tax=Marinospirillum perlucidum TaxID=1982602 RepID=UPI000DF2FD8F|nr:RnfH family protein [Marinospirillum perlucidum]
MPRIEVAYALPDKQKLLQLEVPEGTSVRQAAVLAEMERFFPDIDVEKARLGIFSKPVAKPEEQSVREGDRIEIYRPLLADPKAARAKRAAGD